MIPVPSESSLGCLVQSAFAAAIGALMGGLVSAAIDAIDGSDSGRVERVAVPATMRRLWLGAAFGAVAAVALWWWEVHLQAGLPAFGSTLRGDMLAGLVSRFAAHLVLTAFLAAASIVDLRSRLIPDAITAPGVVAGLAWNAAAPASLLPITVALPRSHALPLLEPDVLGMCGGLRMASWPAWIGPLPSGLGLAVAMAALVGWWWLCTAPFHASEASGRNSAWLLLREPRNWVLFVAAAIVVAAWAGGGSHWRGLLSGIAGLVVAACIVWLTRAGASLAMGREAMGLGDVTLMAMVGAWLGWQPALLACLLGVFVGLGHGVVQMLVHRRNDLPFGPSLAAGTVGVVVAWPKVWERVADAFEDPFIIGLVVVAVLVLTAASLFVLRALREP